MTFQKLPGGTRGPRNPPALIGKLLLPLMMRIHRRKGNRFAGNDLLYLTTVGARSDQQRTVPVARFDDGAGGWFVVGSVGGAVHHPGWYHNMAAHPDQVWAEVSGTKQRVQVEQLDGEQRDRAWTQVIQRSPMFKAYLDKTDRQLPVMHLTPVP